MSALPWLTSTHKKNPLDHSERISCEDRPELLQTGSSTQQRSLVGMLASAGPGGPSHRKRCEPAPKNRQTR
ncbi:hypothetical protein, partial [Comamonas sp.]|uniref:hypothetical protein n=1 Tax=Comamonas sp. TaxID=34028 RepID=UPI00289EA461